MDSEPLSELFALCPGNNPSLRLSSDKSERQSKRDSFKERTDRSSGGSLFIYSIDKQKYKGIFQVYFVSDSQVYGKGRFGRRTGEHGAARSSGRRRRQRTLPWRHKNLVLPVTAFTGPDAPRSPHHVQPKSANGVKGSARRCT
jgi:hypothetical protein